MGQFPTLRIEKATGTNKLTAEIPSLQEESSSLFQDFRDMRRFQFVRNKI